MAVNLGPLDYIMFFAEDIPAAVAFYRDALGATVVEETYPHWARVRVADVDLGLHRGRASGGGVDAGIVRAAFRVTGMAEFRQHVEVSGMTVFGDYHNIPGGVVLTSGDPFGNVLQAIEYGQSAAGLRSAS